MVSMAHNSKQASIVGYVIPILIRPSKMVKLIITRSPRLIRVMTLILMNAELVITLIYYQLPQPNVPNVSMLTSLEIL